MNNKWKTYMAAVMILCMLFVQTGIIAAEEAPLFSLEADTQSVEVGEEYTIRLHADGVTNIYGFEAVITYEPDMAEFIPDISETAPDMDGFTVIDSSIYEGYCIVRMPEENKLLIAFTRVGDSDPISGDTDLFLLKFEALEIGAAGFVLESVKTVDSSENATVYTIGTGISVTCEDKGTEETPVPTPTPTPTVSPTPTPTSIPTSEPTATPVPTPAALTIPGETLDFSDRTRNSILEDGTLEINLPESVIEDIEKDLDEGGTVTIQMGEGDTGQSFKAPIKLFTTVAEKQGLISLDYGNLQLKVPGSAIDMEKICQDNGIEDVSGLQVNLKVIEVPAEELEPEMDASITGKVFQITLDVVVQDGKSVQVTSFTIPIELKIPETVERPEDYVEGTRNVYKIDVDPPQYCYTYFDGENYVVELDGFSKYTVLEYTGSFEDVLESHWAKDYIRVLAAKDIVEGVGDNIFNPGRNVTRAEFAKMIAGALNLKAPVYMGMFNDVASEAWYASYVEAAAQAGIVQGHGSGRFDPDSTITREQMAAMVMNAYAYITGTEAAETAAMYDGEFSDLDDASDWARDSIKAAYVKGFVKGMTADRYIPAGLSQRAQAAAVIVRMLDSLGKL